MNVKRMLIIAAFALAVYFVWSRYVAPRAA